MPGRLGVGWMLHLVPFQRSAMVSGPEGGNPFPVAVQAERDEHETLLKHERDDESQGPCPTAAGGVGVG